jgi:hypothetical protein
MMAGRAAGAGDSLIDNQWVNDINAFELIDIQDLPKLAKTSSKTVTLTEYDEFSAQDQYNIFITISKNPRIQRLVLDWDLDWKFNPNLVIEKLVRLNHCKLSELEIQMDHDISDSFFEILKTWKNLNKINFTCASEEYVRNFITPNLIKQIQNLKQILKDLSIFINGKKVDLEHEYKLAQATPLFSPTAQVTARISQFSFASSSASTTTGRVTRTMCVAAVEAKATESTPTRKRKDSPTRDLDDNSAKRPCTGLGVRVPSDDSSDVAMTQASAQPFAMFNQSAGAGSSSGAGSSQPGQQRKI